ncbi:MAG: RidA family protein [Candidatus Rokuibacteriota bacterium]|nr:MAG: RidA family protein [Candidatus Rokubacteria bacterium]
MKRTHLPASERQKTRAYSPAVITEGGRIVWLAGQTALADENGKDISGNFEAQTHRVFALIDETLRKTGGTLADLVTMTVFIKEARYGDRFVELRRGLFPDGKFPASALITVSNFARPGMEIEIQAIAVIAEEPGAR